MVADDHRQAAGLGRLPGFEPVGQLIGLFVWLARAVRSGRLVRGPAEVGPGVRLASQSSGLFVGCRCQRAGAEMMMDSFNMRLRPVDHGGGWVWQFRLGGTWIEKSETVIQSYASREQAREAGYKWLAAIGEQFGFKVDRSPLAAAREIVVEEDRAEAVGPAK